jgi:hypothetical protein
LPAIAQLYGTCNSSREASRANAGQALATNCILTASQPSDRWQGGWMGTMADILVPPALPCSTCSGSQVQANAKTLSKMSIVPATTDAHCTHCNRHQGHTAQPLAGAKLSHLLQARSRLRVPHPCTYAATPASSPSPATPAD